MKWGKKYIRVDILKGKLRMRGRGKEEEKKRGWKENENGCRQESKRKKKILVDILKWENEGEGKWQGGKMKKKNEKKIEMKTMDVEKNEKNGYVFIF